MSKINSTPTSLLFVISYLPKDIPFELVKELATWNMVIKSPYGFSYYDGPVGWGYKADKSLRIADHWNFTSSTGKRHCETSSSVLSDTHWTIARYNGTSNKYDVIKSYPKSTTSIKRNFEYRTLQLELLKEKAIEKLKEAVTDMRKYNECLSKLELNFLNKYFKNMEECF